MSIVNKSHLPVYVIVTLVTAVLVTLGYTTLVTNAANKKALAQIQMQSRALAVASSLLYGIVESVDVQNRIVTARVINPFSPTETRLLTLHVSDDAFIARQNLLGENGEYSGLTTRTIAFLRDIKSGDRIATLISGSGVRIESNLVIFGDPL